MIIEIYKLLKSHFELLKVKNFTTLFCIAYSPIVTLSILPANQWSFAYGLWHQRYYKTCKYRFLSNEKNTSKKGKITVIFIWTLSSGLSYESKEILPLPDSSLHFAKSQPIYLNIGDTDIAVIFAFYQRRYLSIIKTIIISWNNILTNILMC